MFAPITGDVCVSDTFYRTPLPTNNVEEKLWRLVIDLYPLTNEQRITERMESIQNKRSNPLNDSSDNRYDNDNFELGPARGASAASDGSVSRGSSTDQISGVSSDTATPHKTKASKLPINVQLGICFGPLRTYLDQLSIQYSDLADSTFSLQRAASPKNYNSCSNEAIIVNTTTSSTSSSSSSVNALTSTTPAITSVPHSSSTSQRQSFSRTGNRRKSRLSGSVLDVAIQHPFALVRRELTSLLLFYSQIWCFECCAPVAVAAAVGDVPIVSALLREPGVGPNAGFPLLVAVHKRHHEVVRILLESNRIRPNYGGAFYEAVKIGNRAAALLFLESSAHASTSASLRSGSNDAPVPSHNINVNQFANNEGSTPLTNLIRQAVRLHKMTHGLYVEEASDEEDEELEVIDPKSAHVAVQVDDGPAQKALARCRSSSSHKFKVHYASLSSAMEMLYNLLSHPTIDVNKGYYFTPLQMAVREGCLEIVQLLLLHPSILPNSVSVAADVFEESIPLLRHNTISAEVIRGLVQPPLELALHHRNPRMFALLVQDVRVMVPRSLHMRLEQDPTQWIYVPYLETLAVFRPTAWEGQGWRWRRGCLLAASISQILFNVCNIILWCFFAADVLDNNLTLILLFVYGFSIVLSVWFYTRQRKEKVQVYRRNTLVNTKLDVFAYLCEYFVPKIDHGGEETNVVRNILVFLCVALPPLFPVAEVLMFSFSRATGQKRRMVDSEEEKKNLLLTLLGDLSTEWRSKKIYKGGIDEEQVGDLEDIKSEKRDSESSRDRDSKEEERERDQQLVQRMGVVSNLTEDTDSLPDTLDGRTHPHHMHTIAGTDNPHSPLKRSILENQAFLTEGQDEVNSLSMRINNAKTTQNISPEVSFTLAAAAAPPNATLIDAITHTTKPITGILKNSSTTALDDEKMNISGNNNSRSNTLMGNGAIVIAKDEKNDQKSSTPEKPHKASRGSPKHNDQRINIKEVLKGFLKSSSNTSNCNSTDANNTNSNLGGGGSDDNDNESDEPPLLLHLNDLNEISSDMEIDFSGIIGNESFSRPLPNLGAARAHRRLLEDTGEETSKPAVSPSPPKGNDRARAGSLSGNPQSAIRRKTEGEGTGTSSEVRKSTKRVHFNLVPVHVEAQGDNARHVLSLNYLDPNGGMAAALGEINYTITEIATMPNVTLRNCFFLTYSALAYSRLWMCLCGVFIYLLSLFPEGDTGSSTEDLINHNDEGFREFILIGTCLLGLTTSVVSGAALLLLRLTLQKIDPNSLLFGRRNFRQESDQGPMQSYLV